jgi:hypothetical protein
MASLLVSTEVIGRSKNKNRRLFSPNRRWDKAMTQLTARSTLRDEISIPPLLGIGDHVIRSPWHRHITRRATKSGNSSDLRARSFLLPSPKPGSHAAGPVPGPAHSSGEWGPPTSVFARS